MRRKPSAKQLAGLRRYAAEQRAERKAERARLLKTLRRESARCSRNLAGVDPQKAPELFALARLASLSGGRRVRFGCVVFPLTYSELRGAVRDPDTGKVLVLFLCSI